MPAYVFLLIPVPELTRHSDHQYRSFREYQIRDDLDPSLKMPFGYPTSTVLSLLPPLGFNLMNPRIPAAMRPAR